MISNKDTLRVCDARRAGGSKTRFVGLRTSLLPELPASPTRSWATSLIMCAVTSINCRCLYIACWPSKSHECSCHHVRFNCSWRFNWRVPLLEAFHPSKLWKPGGRTVRLYTDLTKVLAKSMLHNKLPSGYKHICCWARIRRWTAILFFAAPMGCMVQWHWVNWRHFWQLNSVTVLSSNHVLYEC